MIKFYNKTKYGIVLLLVLSMILQVAGPWMGYSFADEIETPSVEEAVQDSEKIDKDEDSEGFIGPKEDGEVTSMMFTPFSTGNNLGNIFTLNSLKVNGVEASENMIVTIADGTTVDLDYTWNTVGKDAKSGDYAEIDIPDAFKLDTNFEDKDIVLSGGEIVGKYSIIDNKLKFVFNDEIEKVGEVTNGVLGFGVKFNEERFKTEVVQEIEFNDEGKKTITIIGQPTKEVSSISKKGTPNASTNAKTITWVVDVTNPSNEAITNAKLKDILPEGLELDSSSIKVNNLNIALNGNLIDGSVVTVGSPTITGQNFELDLPTIAPYKGYRIEYTTTITDNSITQFINNTSLEYGDKILPADTTVSIERSSSIEKGGEYKGYNEDKKNDEIYWWIDVNKSGGSINEAIVEDSLPPELTLVEGSIEIVKLTQNGNNWTESESGKTATVFPVHLGEITDAYRIKFKTSIDYSKVNGGNYKKENSITNETILKDGTGKIGDEENTVPFHRDPILTKTGKHYVDYEKKEIKWTVTVNKANHPIKGAIVTDTLPAGLTISKDDIKVLKGTEDVTNNVTITVPTNDGSTTTEVTIGLGDISEKYTIEYTTKITDFKIDEFLNGASLGGTGVGTGGTIEPVEVKPTKNDYSKSHKGIDYDEKTMNWETVANPTREAFKTLKITDTFPNDGLILLPGTLEVKIGEAVKTLDTDYTLTAIDGNYNNGFVVEFKEPVLPINNKIIMTYTTSYDPEKGTIANTGSGLYKNQARFEGETVNGNSVGETKDDEMKVNEETVKTGKKVGKLKSKDSDGNIVTGWVSGNERKIEWEIYINYIKQNLGTGVTVEDNLGYEGEVDMDSIEIRKYTVASDGNATIGELADIEYTVTQTPEKNNEFTLSFLSAVTERYAIVFTTTVPNISQEIYSNTANTKVGNKEYPYTGTVSFSKADNNLSKNTIGLKGNKVYTDDEVNWNVRINKSLSIIQKDVKIVDTISKGMVYKEDSLKVYKLEGTERILVEDEYKLVKTINGEGETVLEIVFHNEISSTYEIEYTTIVIATDGTVNNKVQYSGKDVIIDFVETSKLKAEQFSYVGGDPSKGKIIINKVDNEGKKITEEAEFEVYYILNGQEQLVGGQTYKTVNGKVEIGNLRLNQTYHIREKSAPNGFKFDSEKDPIEIKVTKAAGKDNSGAYEYSIENDNIKTKVTGKKIWEGGPKPNIEIQLFRNGIKFMDPVELNGKETKTPWSYTWDELDLTDNAGVEYKYTIGEVELPDYYTQTISEDGLTITNIYTSPLIEVTGTKKWVGGDSLERPTIKLQLYRDGEIEGDPVELVNGVTSHTWTKLDKTDENGKDYVYTIDEVSIPENYGKSKSKDSLEITNTYKSPVTDITGRKVWENGKLNQPNSIELQLYRNGEPYLQAVELVSGTYEYVWKDLDITDSAGVDYVYTVKEVETPENYTKVEEGLTVTNTYVIPKTQVTATKEWRYGPSVKPTIELQLYKDGNAYGTPVTLNNGTTNYTWTGLDKTDINGRTHKYTVDEVNVPTYYIKQISSDGLTVTNIYNPPSEPTDPEGKIRIIKKDSKTNELLSGAEFDIVDSRGRRVDTLRTNSRGEATSNWLPVGDYTIEEVDSPDGYILDSTLGEVRIRNGETIEIVIYNEKEDPTEPTDPVEPEEPTDPTDPVEPTDPDDPDEDDEFEDVDGQNPSDRPEGEDELEDGGGDKPAAKPKLPKTGSASPVFLYGLGGLSILVGTMLRRKED